MMKHTIRMANTLFVALLVATGTLPATATENWPTWRGSDSTGAALTTAPPTSWSETENVAWKVKLTGGGQSTPVVWGNKIIILQASSADERAEPTRRPDSAEQLRGTGRSSVVGKTQRPINFNVTCLDRHTGNLLWERTATTAIPHEGHHQAGSFAPYSAVTDGELVFASFGSRGLYCFDLAGNPQWQQDLHPMTIKYGFGEGSSPALAGDVVVVVQDHEGPSKISAFNKHTGKVLWEVDRDEGTSWSTPVTVEVNGRYQVIVNGTNRIRSYDSVTGKVIWECGGMTRNVIPTPVIGFGRVYCSSGFHGSIMKAIDLGHAGDLTDTDAVAWSYDQGTPYVSSALLAGDRIYQLEDIKPIFSCVDAKSGAILYSGERLRGLKQVYASPVASATHVYVLDRNGNTAVIERGDTLKVVALNKLDDGFDASPVIVGNALYLKGNNYFYCIAAS